MNPAVLWLEQAPSRRRFGLKGPGAASLLARHGLNAPARPNAWCPLRAQQPVASPDVIARLGNTEYFIEEQGDATGIAGLAAVLESAPGVAFDGAYPVLREDAAFVLGGARAPEVLAEVCNVNFAALDDAAQPVVMTLMTGVAVLVLPQDTAQGQIYRIWCDPSFGSYLWETLGETSRTSVVNTNTGRGA